MPTIPIPSLVSRVAGPLALPEPISMTPHQLKVHTLLKRQGTIAIPTLYQHQNDSPAPGAVVGITLGSVAGFVLLIWLFSTLTGFGGVSRVSEETIHRRSHSPRSRRTSRRSEVTSHSHGRDRIVRQERVMAETSRAPPPQRTTHIVEERIVPPDVGGNMVEVVVEEEESSIVSAPRRTSRRGGSRYG